MSRVTRFWKHCAHLCLVRNIVCCPIMCSCSKPMSSMHALSAPRMQRLRVGRHLLTRFLVGAVSLLGGHPGFLYWSQTQGGSTEPKGIRFAAVLTREDASPSCFHSCRYLRSMESFVSLASAWLFWQSHGKSPPLFFGFWKPDPQNNESWMWRFFPS